MPFAVHQGQDYIVLVGTNDTTDKPAATFARIGTAKKAATLLNTFKCHPSTCQHHYATTSDGLIDICIHCADMRA